MLLLLHQQTFSPCHLGGASLQMHHQQVLFQCRFGACELRQMRDWFSATSVALHHWTVASQWPALVLSHFFSLGGSSGLLVAAVLFLGNSYPQTFSSCLGAFCHFGPYSKHSKLPCPNNRHQQIGGWWQPLSPSWWLCPLSKKPSSWQQHQARNWQYLKKEAQYRYP